MERQGSRRGDGSDEGGEGDVDGEEQGREVEGRDGKVERVKEHTLLWARREVCSLLPLLRFIVLFFTKSHYQ